MIKASVVTTHYEGINDPDLANVWDNCSVFFYPQKAGKHPPQMVVRDHGKVVAVLNNPALVKMATAQQEWAGVDENGHKQGFLIVFHSR